jgi:hypothetical protein
MTNRHYWKNLVKQLFLRNAQLANQLINQSKSHFSLKVCYKFKGRLFNCMRVIYLKKTWLQCKIISKHFI